MAAADLQESLDPKTRKLRLWWGRAVIAFNAAVAAALAAIVVSAVVDGGRGVGDSLREFAEAPTFWFQVLFAVTLAPIIETGLMAWVLDLLPRSVRFRYGAMFVSALFWAVVHRFFNGPAGWLAFIPFFVFSYVYIERGRGTDGFITAVMCHIVFNLMALSLMVSNGFVR